MSSIVATSGSRACGRIPPAMLAACKPVGRRARLAGSVWCVIVVAGACALAPSAAVGQARFTAEHPEDQGLTTGLGGIYEIAPGMFPAVGAAGLLATTAPLGVAGLTAQEGTDQARPEGRPLYWLINDGASCRDDADPYDDFDAAMAAGSLLHDNGADATLGQRTWNAVRAYNGSGPVAVAYADSVLTRARAWAQDPTPGAGPGANGATLLWPVHGPVSSVFCERRSWETCHPGIDIAVASGTAILAAAAGRVELTQATLESGGYGNYTCLQHTAAVSTCYAHQARILVRAGQLIARGQPIGSSDCTGRCFGPHLHFEVRLNGQPVCPAPYLNTTAAELCAPGAPGT